MRLEIERVIKQSGRVDGRLKIGQGANWEWKEADS
jgi:hypothetical protein